MRPNIRTPAFEPERPSRENELPANAPRVFSADKPGYGIGLTAFVCAHNEEANLAQCLERLRFADEIVVLLDRCTDGSEAVAQRLADRVICGSFPLEGPRRMTAQASCSGDWILEIDADELLPVALAVVSHGVV